MATWDGGILWDGATPWATGDGDASDLASSPLVINCTLSGGSLRQGIEDLAGASLSLSNRISEELEMSANSMIIVMDIGTGQLTEDPWPKASDQHHRAVVPSSDLRVVRNFDKQPLDIEVYEIDWEVKYLMRNGDQASRLVALTHSPGIEVESQYPVGGRIPRGVIMLRVSGGKPSNSYRITARISTVGGREKEADISVTIIEI